MSKGRPLDYKYTVYSPCKDCTSRFIGCHSECIQYKDFRQKLDVLRAEESRRKSLENESITYLREVLDKKRRRKSR